MFTISVYNYVTSRPVILFFIFHVGYKEIYRLH